MLYYRATAGDQSGDCLVGGAKVFHTRTDVPRTPTIRAHIQQEVWKMALVHTYAYILCARTIRPRLAASV